MMPILSYFAVVGSVLVALLFMADATLEKSGPLPFNNEAMGLPKAWYAETEKKGTILTAMPAPAPDMTSDAVRAAAPPAPAVAAAAPAEPVPERTAKLDTAPKKKPKRVAHRQPRPDDYRRTYAWSRNNYAWSSRNGYDGGLFGGGNQMFGRF